MTTHDLSVTGMTCAGCAGRVERGLAALPGATRASVNLAAKRARVTLEGDIGAVAAKLREVGYPAAETETVLAIEGMTCGSCVGRVEAALNAVPGVTGASVNLATSRATVTHLDSRDLPRALEAAVARAGYSASDATVQRETPADRQRAEAAELKRDLILAALLTLPVFVLEMGGHLVPAIHHWTMATLGQTASWTLQFVLTLAVLAGPGRRFYRIGIPALLRGAPEMNSLVALGTGAAFAYSSVALLAPGLLPDASRAVYFEAAAVIVTLILMGRWLEARARGQTGAAITGLMDLAPDTARHAERGEVAVAEIAPGDLLELRPGDRVPVDGEVVSGTTTIDESMLTGEPVPVTKAPGEEVTAGTVNGTGALTFRATRVGRDTALARIVALVEEAQGTKLPIQALADRIALVFVPVVLGLAALTVLAWLLLGPEPALTHALVAGVSVLIIACPCALGLATPVSIMVGTGRGAREGVLFRRGDALQALEGVRTVAFDKTGTLTQGKPKVTTVLLAEGETRETVLARAAAVERLSEHPLAQAILDAAEGLSLPQVTGHRATPGQGIRAEIEGSEVLVGSPRFLAEKGIETTLALTEPTETPVLIAWDGKLRAVLGLSDPAREGAAEAIAALHRAGLQTALISGDRREAAEAIGLSLGIDRITAGVLPEGKLDALAALPGPVAFVGDGLNDAPALAKADVGIAMGSGTDVAIEAADVVLVSADPGAVARAVRLSKATMRNIRQNLFWAFAYNVALIPVAMGALYPFTGTLLSPALAAGAMAMSSVFVLWNALRLRRAAT